MPYIIYTNRFRENVNKTIFVVFSVFFLIRLNFGGLGNLTRLQVLTLIDPTNVVCLLSTHKSKVHFFVFDPIIYGFGACLAFICHGITHLLIVVSCDKTQHKLNK